MDRVHLEAFVNRHSARLLVATIAGLAVLAWVHRFMQDDAFISFRYARHLVTGHGLVWNPGEHIEGFSNFLWTILTGVGLWAGVDPVFWSQILGIASFIISLTLTFRLSTECFESRLAGWLTVLLLGWNYTFHSFATGGLETQFQTSLFLLLVTLLVRMDYGRKPSTGKLFAFAVISSVAMMTRLDSVIVCSLLEGYMLLHFLLSDMGVRAKWAAAWPLLVTQTIILVPWVAWKYSYFGELFPNPFYLRTSDTLGGLADRGIRYIGEFIISYWLIPLCVVGLFAVRAWIRAGNRFLILTAIILLSWIVYLVAVGGDFMEFRLLVPVMPFMFILITWLLINIIRPMWVRIVFIILILVGSVYHQVTFSYDKHEGIEPIAQLEGHLVHPDENWIGIGKMLASLFGGDPSIIIATTAAGAIPYYSGLTTVDMLGVNDRWVIEHGVPIGSMAGHQLVAPLSYLLLRNVNLILSHPLVVRQAEAVHYFLLLPMDAAISTDSIRVIEFPLDHEYKLIAWYLVHHRAVDELIGRSHLRTYTVSAIGK